MDSGTQKTDELHDNPSNLPLHSLLGRFFNGADADSCIYFNLGTQQHNVQRLCGWLACL